MSEREEKLDAIGAPEMVEIGTVPAKRTVGRPFTKGVSGNPSGRPKRTQEQKDVLAAIKKLAPNAAEMLKQLLIDPNTPHAVRLKAAEVILDRTYGKPEAQIKVDDAKRDALTDIQAEVARIRTQVTDK